MENVKEMELVPINQNKDYIKEIVKKTLVLYGKGLINEKLQFKEGKQYIDKDFFEILGSKEEATKENANKLPNDKPNAIYTNISPIVKKSIKMKKIKWIY